MVHIEQVYHLLPCIFKHIDNIKDKGRIERVCKTFKHQSFVFESWSNIIFLKFKEDNSFDPIYWINDSGPFKRTTYSSTIEAILLRSRNLKSIDISQCRSKLVYWMFSSSLIYYTADHFKFLKEVIFNCHHLVDKIVNVAVIINIFKDQLTSISIVNVPDIETKNLWNTIGKCNNLSSLTFKSPIICNYSSPSFVKNALQGKFLTYLNLSISSLHTHDLVEIINNLANKSSLKYLSGVFPFLHLTNFISTAPNECLQNLKYLRWLSGDTLSVNGVPNEWSTILKIPYYFPSLVTLDVTHACSYDKICELIVTYINLLNGRKFNLKMLSFFSSKKQQLQRKECLIWALTQYGYNVKETLTKIIITHGSTRLNYFDLNQ